MRGQIANPVIQVQVTKKLCDFLTDNVKSSSSLSSTQIPYGISCVIFKNMVPKARSKMDFKYLVTNKDQESIKQLNLDQTITSSPKVEPESKEVSDKEKFLTLEDLHWLYSFLQTYNDNRTSKVYLHELLDNSKVILPENIEIPRNQELEKRCHKLRASQQNQEYHSMTKNVDCVRKRYPDDTFAFQMRQMNRHLIAIFQFVVSVLCGFAFGFVGVEFMIGTQDFGFRLLLGIIFALVIALADLYFLAKKLNEDLMFETSVNDTNKKPKID